MCIAGMLKKNWYKDLKIRNKILLLFVPITVITIIIFANASNELASRTIVKKTEKNSIDNSILIVNRIETIFKNAENCGNMLALNLNRTIVLNQEAENYKNVGLRLYNSLSNEISYARIIFPDVNSVAFIDINNNIYASNNNMNNNFSEAQGSFLFSEIEKTSGINYWFPMGKRDFLVDNSNEPVMTIGKRITNSYTGDRLGYLVLNINEKDISSVYKSMGIIGSGKYFIVDINGTIISSSDNKDMLKPIGDKYLKKYILENDNFSKQMKIGNINYLVTSEKFPDRDFKLISMIPLKELLIDSRKLSIAIQMASLLCAIALFIGSIYISKLITDPIVKLKNNMLMVQKGNLDIEFEDTSKDEVGLLTSGFQVMIAELKELIKKYEIEQKKKREYEISLLHEQIKPHFLYNTLDVIYTLSEMGMNADVQKTTKSLADYYRVVLSNGREVINIDEEIKSVKDYLAIQQIRYNDVFDYDIDVENDIKEYVIPKLTLQPIVENAIYHGLKWKDSFGHLSIKGFRKEENIIFIIHDNGAGMNKEKVESIMKKSNDKKSFGLYNVNKRIQIYFGEKFGIDIKSEPLKYTEVILTIPSKKEGEIL